MNDEHIMSMTLEMPVVSIKDGVSRKLLDRIIREDIFKVKVNSKTFISLACLPENLEELAVGFLRSEGVIPARSDVTGVQVDREARFVNVEGNISRDMLEKSLSRRFLTSGCGIVPAGRDRDSLTDDCLKLKSDFVVPAETIMNLMHEMNTGCMLFNETGAAHTAALALDGKIAGAFEDISRHNAVDKVIGRAFLGGWDTSKGILFSSGRLSLEIVVKCATGRIPIIVSRTAPMQMGVEVADELLLTLVGFTRGRRMNVYTHPWRIK